MRFEHPEAFLLGLLVVGLLRRGFAHSIGVGVWRVLLLLCLLTVLAGPWRPGQRDGRDLILVLDRSRSVPIAAEARAAELAEQVLEYRGEQDRVALLVFGRDAVLEQAPSEAFRWERPESEVDPEGSDLAVALRAAMASIPSQRRGSILLVTDGEHTGSDDELGSAVREAQRRGIRVDAIPMLRPDVADVAVADVVVPPLVESGEPFQFTGWIRAEVSAEVTVVLRRDGIEQGRQSMTLRAGANRVVFRDRCDEPGVHRYTVAIVGAGDAMPENDRSDVVVTVAAPFRALCVNQMGRPGRLAAALEAAGVEVVVTGPDRAPLDANRLEGFRVVILENVRASDLPRGGMEAVRAFVEERGGGLLMTGGERAFGTGGYLQSPLEEVLPVSMEIRDEQRKFALALAIAVDISGSMSAPVKGGRTKMDLANDGALAALQLLGRSDGVAVMTVDTAPEVVVDVLEDLPRRELEAKVRGIRTGGGGIFVGAALEAAREQLLKSRQETRHLVLFADAGDATNPGDYEKVIGEMVQGGATISVIGLGRGTDRHASLLREVARLGQGRVQFVEDAADLPRVFAEETVRVARSSIVDVPTQIRVRPELGRLGAQDFEFFPIVGGYSLAWLRSGAGLGLETVDDAQAPALAFWSRGLGRAGAFLPEVDGELSGDLGEWSGRDAFFGTLVRWLGGRDGGARVLGRMVLDGHDGRLEVEVAPGDEAVLAGVTAWITGPDRRRRPIDLRWEGPTRRVGVAPVMGAGIYRPMLELEDGSSIRVPAVALPQSPEFALRAGGFRAAGESVLRGVTSPTGGRLDPLAADAFAGRRDGQGIVDLTRWFAWAALGLLLLEVAWRRFGARLPRGVFRRLEKRQRAKAAAAPVLAERPAQQATPKKPKSEPAESEQLLDVLSRIKKR